MQPRPAVVGLSYDVHDPGNYMSDIFTNSFLMPYPSRGWESMKLSLQDIVQKMGVNMLIPCLDAELPLMITHQTQIAQMGLRTLLPTEKQFALRGKDQLAVLANAIGCLHPKTRVVHNMHELSDVLQNDMPLPVVIKGKYYKAYVVYTMEAALSKAASLVAEWGFPLLVQEKIEGQEVNMIGLSNEEGQVRGRVSITKQLTTELGKVWTAVTIRDARLDRICDNFGQETRWRGPFELECMTNQHGVYLIEINPRFPSWVYFSTSVGVNLPEMLVQMIALGDCLPRLDYPLGKYLVRYSSEFVTDLDKFHNLLSTGNRDGL